MRIYPLRTSSNIWKIKIYSKHICNNDCKLSYIEEQISNQSSVFFIINNPNYNEEKGKCSYSMKFDYSFIHLFYFNKNNPQTIDGELLFENNIVIPHNEIYISLNFPISKEKKILVKSENSMGFTLIDIIDKIKNIYIWIYEEEEKTSTVKTHLIIDKCACKVNYKENLILSLTDNIENIDNNICSICLEKESNVFTACNHSFHKNCISEWIENDKETCPICRTKLFVCNQCQDGIINRQYIGKVIPRDKRGINFFRNSTDGIFNISKYDIEDLFLTNMEYNSITKTLYPKIFV